MIEEPGKKDRVPKALSDQALLFMVRLHSGENEPQTRSAFDAWRSQGPAHAEAAAEAEALWNDLSHIHRDPASGRIKPGRQRPVFSRRQTIGGIIGLGLAGGAGTWLQEKLPSYLADFSTGLGETRTVDLPDGSRMTLNAKTVLNLHFEARARRLDLIEGQAFFEVTPDAARPFEVHQSGRTVTALGTAFDVNAMFDDDLLAVSVSQHSVKVRSEQSGDGLILNEGERVIIHGDGRIGAISRQDRESVALWRTGSYVAEERPLGEVVRALRAYYPGWIVVRDKAISDLRVNAVLDLRRPGASLEALAGGLPIRVYRLSDVLTVIEAE